MMFNACRFIFSLAILFFSSIYSVDFTVIESDQVLLEGDTLILKGPVIFEHPVGTVKADQAIIKRSSQGKKSITLDRNVKVTLTGVGKLEAAQQITIDFDPTIQQIHLRSETDQLFFHDNIGKIYADEVTITYDFNEGQPFADLVVLEGSVKLLNREGALLQYALADRVAFHHHTKEMHFTALPQKRVLFYDKINNLQVSAPQLKMKRNRVTKKNEFKGIGDVRFQFAEEEYEQLRKRFLLEKKGL